MTKELDGKLEKLQHLNFFGLYLWLGLITFSLSLYFFRPDLFNPQHIRQFFTENLISGLFIYFVISTLRGLTLIPSTPILLAGILVFPPLPLWIVNQFAVYSSSAIVYYLARHLGFDRYFHAHYPTQISRLSLLLKKAELTVISTWGFLPFVPSDLIVYVCSVLRVSVVKTLLGISIGEGVICAIYIFGGAYSMNLLLELL
ncbi:MAG: VTT domain-containing protein [Saccharospirillum sp.]|nr:VTT domain-containing protein [Saccharospirillum sp.]